MIGNYSVCTLSLKDSKFTEFFLVFFGGGEVKVMIDRAVGTRGGLCTCTYVSCTYPYSTYYTTIPPS